MISQGLTGKPETFFVSKTKPINKKSRQKKIETMFTNIEILENNNTYNNIKSKTKTTQLPSPSSTSKTAAAAAATTTFTTTITGRTTQKNQED